MANENRKKIIETLTKLGLLDKVQLVEGKNPKQVTSIWYMGKQYRTSALCGQRLVEFFELLKQGIEPNGSVAKQKINQAHGYSEDMRNTNQVEQTMTYADDFAGIKFVKRNPFQVLLDCIDTNETAEVKHWALTMQSIHCKPFDDEDLNRKKGMSKDALMAMIKDMIENEDVVIIDNHVTAKCRFVRALDRWEAENDRKLAEKQNILNDFIKQAKAWA